MSLPAPLLGLAAYPQFILYRLVPKPDGRTDKKPCDPLGNTSNAHDPSNWMSCQEAETRAAALGLGMGFVVTDGDPFFFIDIDACLQPDGQWSPEAIALCQRFPGACIEISQSGSGLHIIGTAHNPPPHKCEGLLFTSRRFVALTGAGAVGDVGADHTGAVDALISERLQPDPGTSAEGWTDEPCPEWRGPADDVELLTRALRSQSAASAFMGKARFLDLWGADLGVLGACYPDDHGARAYDASSADAALCSHLAFWTGKDCARMDRMFRESALYREKWEAREDYRQRTILGAVSRCSKVYQERAPVAAEGAERAAPSAALMAYHQQAEHFTGCVYVRHQHRVFVPDGATLTPDRFRATYGGHVFAMDKEFLKTSTSAFEVFTESRAVRFPWAEDICFRPQHPPGAIVTEGGRRLVNIYVPAEVPCRPGDVTPFLSHMGKLLPDQRDRGILLAYMAAVVQYPGVKFQWAPLVQGVEGNGKTMVLEALSEAVGWQYVHYPNAQDLGNKFNPWLRGKILIGIEEIKVGDRWETMEVLKRLVTNRRLEMQPKGVDQTMGENLANFLMFSNHLDSVIKGRKDRRYCPFHTAQQEPEHLIRDGMGGQYFPNLYAWFRREGYAHVTHWLRGYPIPAELDPSGASHRAPVTTSTKEALQHSLGPVEQEIAAAIGEERPGFKGGWVSSIAVDKLIKEMKGGRGVSRNKRKGIMAALGYSHHPALPGGRSGRLVTIDGGRRPRLYVERDGALWDPLANPIEVVGCYEAAQTIG